MDVTLTTDSALVSERPAVAHPGTRGRLNVAVAPRTARAGRATRFTFRVTASGQPVRGAVVRFGGKRVRTNASGAARLAVRFRWPGTRKVRAADPAHRVGRATVSVRR